MSSGALKQESDRRKNESKLEELNNLYKYVADYYMYQGIVSKDTLEEFLNTIKTPLLNVFYVHEYSSGNFTGYAKKMKVILKNLSESLKTKECFLTFPTPLSWFKNDCVWKWAFKDDFVSTNECLELKQFLYQQTSCNNIVEFDVLDMLPIMLLNVDHTHKILDMSGHANHKPHQISDLIQSRDKVNGDGLLVIVEADLKRCLTMSDSFATHSSPRFAIMNLDPKRLPLLNYTSDINGCTNILMFDRVFAFLPSSNDGLARNSPEVVRGWTWSSSLNHHGNLSELLNSGLGVLKIGGRLVYAVNSMNPVEGEAVISTVLYQQKGSVGLVDVSSELPDIIYEKGVTNWKILTNKKWYRNADEVPQYLWNQVWTSMFPLSPEITGKQHLERCIRILPHKQNTSGMFIAVLERIEYLEEAVKREDDEMKKKHKEDEVLRKRKHEEEMLALAEKKRRKQERKKKKLEMKEVKEREKLFQHSAAIDDDDDDDAHTTDKDSLSNLNSFVDNEAAGVNVKITDGTCTPTSSNVAKEIIDGAVDMATNEMINSSTHLEVTDSGMNKGSSEDVSCERFTDIEIDAPLPNIDARRNEVDDEDVYIQKNVDEDVYIQKNVDEDVYIQKNVDEDVYIQKNVDEDVYIQKNVDEDVYIQKDVDEDVYIQKNVEYASLSKQNENDNEEAQQNEEKEISRNVKISEKNEMKLSDVIEKSRQDHDHTKENLNAERVIDFPILSLDCRTPFLDEIKSFYGLSSDFPCGQLYVRMFEGIPFYCYLVSDDLDLILKMNLTRYKFASVGVKIFAYMSQEDVACRLRITQEGAKFIYPYMSRQILQPSKKDMIIILSKPQIEVCNLSPSLQNKISRMDRGSFIISYEPTGDDDFDGPLILSCLRSNNIYRCFLSCYQRFFYLRMLGVPFKSYDDSNVSIKEALMNIVTYFNDDIA